MKKKKSIVVICLLAILVVLSVAIVLLTKKKNGIEVEGNLYTFSAENGIDNYEKINDGIVTLSGLNYKYFADGGSEWVESKDEYSNYYQPRVVKEIGTDHYKMGSMQFIFTDDFVIDKNLGPDASAEDIEAAGYKVGNSAMIYTQFATEDGNIDWKDIEEDYNTAKEDGGFDNLEYHEVIKDISPDVIKFSLGSFEETEKAYKDIHSEDVKKDIMLMLGHAKLCHQLSTGEIEYFLVKEIYVKDRNSLAVIIFSDSENVEKWTENWGGPSN